MAGSYHEQSHQYVQAGLDYAVGTHDIEETLTGIRYADDIHAREHDHPEDICISPDEFEAILSTSLPSTAGCLGLGLAPEPDLNHHDHSIVSQRRSKHPRNRRNSVNTMESGVTIDQEDEEEPLARSPFHHNAAHHPPDEETPLLAPSSSSSTYSNTTNDPPSPYLSGVSPARFRLLFTGLMLIHFVSCFDTTIMASSHPIITSYFDASNSASWLSTSFLLTSTSFQPLFGSLSDVIGRKTPYIACTLIFTIATIWCALATSMTSFILARAVCGLGAGGVLTLGTIMISDLVPIERRGVFQSWINVSFGMGSMSGAALGGVLADYLGWRWEFGIQVPLLLVGLVVSCLTVPGKLGFLEGNGNGIGNGGEVKGTENRNKGFKEAMRSFDFTGSVLMSSGVTFLVLGLSLGGNVLPWSDPLVIGSLTIFALIVPVFLYVETKAIKPIMPIHLVKLSPYRNLLFCNTVAAIISYSVLFNVPLFFQGVLLSSATTSGLRLLTCSLVSSTAGATTGLLVTRTRRLKWPLVAGTSLIILGTVCLASLQRSWPSWAYVLVLVPTHTGMGFQYSSTAVSILAVGAAASTPSPPTPREASPSPAPDLNINSNHNQNKTNTNASQQQKKEKEKEYIPPQAVINSTLILFRSLGMMLGISCSSLVVQNGLWYYLEAFVQGPQKEFIVEEVRKSVESIRILDQPYRDQVISAYQSALRVCFLCCVGLAVVNWLVMVPVRLPRLGRRA
ncbi:major facilitator superfamily transporter [Naviculisporaceae sp. PSN 640]